MDLVFKLSSLILLLGIILFVLLPAGIEDYILVLPNLLGSVINYITEEFWYNMISWKGILAMFLVPLLWVLGMMAEGPY